MPFKINISHNGKTYKLETENEALIGKKIGETIEGNEIGDVLKNYVLKITGTSDIAGIPGIIGLDGFNYHRKLLTYGKGMRDKRNGVRLRKTLRGEKISDKTKAIIKTQTLQPSFISGPLVSSSLYVPHITSIWMRL